MAVIAPATVKLHPDKALITRSGRTIKVTPKMAQYVQNIMKDDQERQLKTIFDKLCKDMSDVDMEIKACRPHAVHEHYRAFITDYGQYLQTEEDILLDLPSDDKVKHEKQYERQSTILRTFKASVEDFLTKNPMSLDTLSPKDSASNIKSHLSRSSVRSNVSLLRLQEEQKIAELSARKAALNEQYHIDRHRKQIEMEQRAKTEELRLQQQQLDDLAQLSKYELNRLEEEFHLHTEMAVSEAKAQVFEKYERGSNMSSGKPQNLAPEAPTSSPTVTFNPTMNYSAGITAPVFTSTPFVAQQTLPTSRPLMTEVNQATHPLTERSCSPNDLSRLADLLANRQDNLPQLEPEVFKGDILKYPLWIKSFESLIEDNVSTPSKRLYYLQKYTAGEAREAIQGLVTLNDDSAYMDARRILDERYGNAFIISEAYRSQLMKWPVIKPNDGRSLRKFSDFLCNCLSAMNSIDYLNVLNDVHENQNLLSKLPKYVCDRWGRIVDDCLHSYENCCYPNFAKFCEFLKKEARIACGPASIKSHQEFVKEQPRRMGGGQTNARSFASHTEVPDSNIEIANCNATSTQSAQNTPRVLSCTLCKAHHKLEVCPNFLKINLRERMALVRSKGLCMGCLRWGHLKRDCRSKQSCEKCKGCHPTPLHDDSYVPQERALVGKGPVRDNEVNAPKKERKHEVVSHRTEAYDGNQPVQDCFHSLIVPVYLSHESKPDGQVLVYALLDPQSNSCFIAESTLSKIGAEGPKIELKLSTMLGEEIVRCKKVSGLVIRDLDNGTNITLPPTYSRNDIPASHSQIPRPETVSQWPHLVKVAENLHPYEKDVEIGLLIGTNCARVLKPRDIVPGQQDDPYAIKTDLGWGVIGMMDNSVKQNAKSFCRAVTIEERSCHFSFRTQAREISPVQVTGMFEREFNERESEEKVSIEDRRFLKLVSDGIIQRDDGHFQIPLPFKQNNLKLPNNRPMAEKRLKRLKAKMKSDKRYKTEYTAFMNDMIAKGYAEKVPPSQDTLDNGRIWYLPHHGVIHAKKSKLRVVFDCSAEYQSETLNHHLLQGPDMNNNLVGVLCRFRKEVVALSCDIEGMFLQVSVNPKDRDFLRLLWWENDDFDMEPIPYRMTVHPFGATSSPACASFALKRTADTYEKAYGKAAADFLRRDFYVDDGLKSVATTSEALQLIKSSTDMCKEGGFNLHKYVCNNKDVLSAIPNECRAKDVQSLDLLRDKLPVERTLGIQWCVESDTFQFVVVLKDQPFTRRGILSSVSSIYDPMGLVSPFLLKGKKILQELCRDGANWDDPIPDEMRMRWDKWRTELKQLSDLKIRRCYREEKNGTPEDIQLHHFSDASTEGYGQCSYLRLTDSEGNVSCSLVMSKSRVAPSKPVTMPRLELAAAVVSVRIGRFLERELDYENISHFYWTDSMVVLGYIANEARRFHIYVANRVQTIRNSTTPDQWGYVDTKVNPADLASRGIGAEELKTSSLWWKGPDFLSANMLPPTEITTPELVPEDPEVRKVTTFFTKAKSTNLADILTRLERFSSWHSVRRAIAVCMRFKKKLLDRSVKRPKEIDHSEMSRIEMMKTYAPVNVEEMKQAEDVIIKMVQGQAFSKERDIMRKIKSHEEIDNTRKRKPSMKESGSLYRLDPFLDQHDLVRVGGRIKRANMPKEVTNPVILPRHSHITMLVILHYHKQCGHSGRGMTLNNIRAAGYWIIAGTSAVTSHIWHCVMCRKLRGANLGQKMADLPNDRLDPSPPFSYSAVDLFGPFLVKEGRRELKRYGTLFTCLVSRAVHIEIAHSLSTDSFLNAYRRFVGRRGPIRQLRSDRGTNFVGAKGELQHALDEMDHNKIRQEMLKEQCDWVSFAMNFPHSSHKGGVWERQIRSVRNALSAILMEHGSQLNDELLATFMVEAEAIVNSRPLTFPDMGSPDASEPISPSQLLTLKTKVVLPPPGVFQREDLYCRRRWRRVQYLADQFWSRWKVEFLPTLQPRQKWTKSQPNIAKDDIVLMIDEQVPRCSWPLGRVLDTFPGNDGLVRKVRLAVRQSTYERPVHKLVLLIRRGDPVEEPPTDVK